MSEVDTPTPSSQPSAVAHELGAGSIVGGKYKILSLIGKGGMGSVYRVEHVFLRTEFAMKTMDVSQLSDTTVRRFQQEAKAAASLNHPNVVRVHDFGLVDEQQPFYIMDLVDGKSLHHYLKESGMLPVDLAKRLFVQICNGLGAAHDQGVVHRDIKPGNIIWCKPGRNPEEGDVKIIDFGIAKVMDSDAHTLTSTGQVIGSPSYMSPEQCLGLAVDRRSDIYSLGCMFFEMLTGLPPFIGENALATMMRHQSETAPTLKEATLGKDYPQELERVVAKMLRKDAARRYQDVHAILSDLHAKDDTALVSGTRMLAEQAPKMPGEVRINAGVFAVLMLMNSVLSAAVVILCCYLMAPKPVGNFTPRAKLDNTMLLSERMPLQAGLDGLPELIKVRTILHHDALPSSESNSRGGFTLHFGPPPSWGKVWVRGQEMLATGDVVVPPKTFVQMLISNSNMSDNFLSKFKGDELDSISFEDRGGFKTSAVKQLIKFKHLKEVNLWRNDFDDQALVYIEQLPSLERLDAASSGITARALSGFSKLMNLKSLRYGPMHDPGQVMRKLASSKILDSMIVEGNVIDKECSLTDADLEVLAANQTIVSLFLTNQPRLTARGVAKLANMKKLTNLYMENANITGADFPELAKLKNLREISLIGTRYTVLDRAKLHRLMPWLSSVEVRPHTSPEDPDKKSIRDDLLRLSDDPLGTRLKTHSSP